MKHVLIIALIAMFASTPATAQDEAATGVKNTPEAAFCELHVWPADAAKSFSTLSETDWATFVEVRKYSRDPNNPLSGTQASVAVQTAVFGALDLPGLLHLPGYAVVLHDTPLPSRVLRTTKGRILAESTPCYAELITDDVFFQESMHKDYTPLDSGVLNTTFRFRRFDGGDSPSFSFGTFITGDLYKMGKRTEFTFASAIARFETVFAESVTKFAAAIHTSSSSKEQGKKRK